MCTYYCAVSLIWCLFYHRVLLRVRMLYYLKQEVIGEHAESVLKGADIRYKFQRFVYHFLNIILQIPNISKRDIFWAVILTLWPGNIFADFCCTVRILYRPVPPTNAHSLYEVTWDTQGTNVFAFRAVDIWMPEMEQQEVPAGWWDGEADRSLLAGVFKHGKNILENGKALLCLFGYIGSKKNKLKKCVNQLLKLTLFPPSPSPKWPSLCY